MFQSEVDGRLVDWGLLVKDVLPQYHHDLDYLISMLDWDANVNPEFAKSNKRHPVPVRPVKETADAGYRELWITYGNAYYSAKELTVLPGRSVTIKDAAAYGLILTQGHGTFGRTPVSTPSMIRFGQRRAETCAAKHATLEESSPPLSRVPTATSLRSRSLTASSRSASTSSAKSRRGTGSSAGSDQ